MKMIWAKLVAWLRSRRDDPETLAEWVDRQW